ncbi:MAG: ParA family protein [Deltaproteobacteria bacterium]|nr:ParA family protein [Deltaproteobacteria bacterium]
MRRVIFNQKGGVGKTSIACNLAAISAARGLRTLIVDLDVQGNTSYYLGNEQPLNLQYAQDRDDDGDGTIAELFKQTMKFFKVDGKQSSNFIHETPYEDLFLMPSSPALKLMERELESRYKIYKLRDALDRLDDEFDRVYIDTPPCLNFYSRSALIAADTVLIPFDCDSFSRQSLYSLRNNILEIREDHNPDLEIEGIVVNQFNPQARLPGEIVDEMKREGLPIFETTLPSSVKMKESHQRQIPLIHFAAAHKLTQQYVELFDEIEATRNIGDFARQGWEPSIPVH